jgi:hypothetical protein
MYLIIMHTTGMLQLRVQYLILHLHESFTTLVTRYSGRRQRKSTCSTTIQHNERLNYEQHGVGRLADCYSSEFHRSGSAIYPWLDVVPPTEYSRNVL